MASSTCSASTTQAPDPLRGPATTLSLRAVRVAAALALGLALAGCGGGIEGAPTCDAKKANLQGQVGANTVAVDAGFSGGLKQSDKGGTLAGTFGSSMGSISLTWPSQVADGVQTPVGGQLSLQSVMGGAVCVGDGSILEVESSGSNSFHLTNLTNCESGGSLPGDILGCISP
jgi:hypothetical protein